MTPAARLQAAIEILDNVIVAARENGAPADAIVTRYFKRRRYAGSKDRRAVRELVFRAIRRSAELPASGRAAIVGLCEDEPTLVELLGQPRGPEPITASDRAAPAGIIPGWLQGELSPLVKEDEWPALLDRAPLDLRVNAAKANRDDLLARFPAAVPTPLSLWGMRLPPESRIDDRPEFEAGLVEVQDEGSQLIALACDAKDGEQIIDLCAGAGGKTLAIAAVAPQSVILATDSDRTRLLNLGPRASRADVHIESMLLNPPNELEQLDDWRGNADLVLVDAPCSGSGTWRRNPEGRWRLTPERLDRVVALQERLLDLGAELVRPGGRLVFAVCSLLSREGAGQIECFQKRHSSWISEETGIPGGRPDGPGRLLTPGHDATDGFFVARLRRPC
ncbi:MAG TPA: RsmB/NOP family class I SAM-dependent RNA methyltransferase [Sphingomicrobium sp.]|nr:RsmB/NOP family class I SAM-dependent RNA methyltransferase [Sphingomicrobium sp.]